MRVLMIGWEYPPHNSGGLGVACQGIVEHLIDSGQELLLVLPGFSEEDDIVMLQTHKGNSYPVVYVKMFLNAYDNGVLRGRNLIEDTNDFARRIYEKIKNEKFDLIHVHDWLCMPAGILLKKRFSKPLIVQIHSTEYDRTGGGEPNIEVEKIEKEGLEQADEILAVSGYTKGILMDKYAIPNGKIQVVYNGINEETTKNYKTSFLDEAPVILFVGRLTIQKGPEYFIDLAQQILREKPNAIFVIAGDGDLYKKMAEYAAFRELTGSVLFTGFLRGESKDRLFERADVFVMPSVSEPFGLVALEAAVYGVPVVVSKTSGVAEVLPSAIKVDFWDVNKTAKEVLNLLSDPDKKKFLGEKVRTEAEMVTWDRTANQLKNIYQQLFSR